MQEETDISLWVEKIGQAELPILNKTNSYITSTDTYLKSHASDIAKAILHDPNMTTKILRLANSVFFNAGNAKINTVSKAVVYLGYDAIRSICFSTAIFEKLITGRASGRVLSSIANSVHAAVQAKLFADARKEKNSEEVFIAALLYNIGELSFWSLDCPEAEKIEGLIKKGQDFESAQKATLGFDFTDLTTALASDWQISEILDEALNDDGSLEGKALSISLGYRTVKQIEEGWESKEGRTLLKQLGEYTKLDTKKLQEKIKTNTKEAISVIREFGLSNTLEYVPGSPESQAKIQEQEKIDREKKRSNPEVQVHLLSELTAMLGKKVDLNQVIELALKGMVNGGGMDRAVAAIKNPKLNKIKGKFVVEKVGTGARDKFDFTIVEREGNIYDLVLKKLQTLWVHQKEKQLYNQEEVQLIMARMGVDSFVVGPIMVNGKTIGLYYADRVQNEFQLNGSDFDVFNLFAKQSGVCLQSFG